ncbi:MAG: UDP-N-acetylglucosamine 2-epimerase (non-hydrolyzing) [Thaumarchaeota archaeon]|nr:UDP-N-acetylglucosamine 2-epimerase (non-hydrolyzing) [Nitrososphaerota archaeon]
MKAEYKVLQEGELERKIAVVVGTRPGIIKMSSIIRELDKRRVPFFVIHSGQHYSPNMDKIFFQQLSLRKPKYRVKGKRGAQLHGEQTARMLTGIEKTLLKERPSLVLVDGDANTNLAGALAARKLGISLGHVEAGLRSSDWRMPEEHNRVMIDHISDLLFAPTQQARSNLITDNVKGRVHVVGNTISDVLSESVKIAKDRIDVQKLFDITPSDYIVLTLHREETVDNPSSLIALQKVVNEVSVKTQYPIVFPMHPRTKKRFDAASVRLPKSINVMPPLGYLEFLAILSNSFAVMTDSGGIQEESCILKVPCLTLRENTERPETITVGSNVLVGLSSRNILHALETFRNSPRKWLNPYPRGATKKIVDISVGAIERTR